MKKLFFLMVVALFVATVAVSENRYFTDNTDSTAMLLSGILSVFSAIWCGMHLKTGILVFMACGGVLFVLFGLHAVYAAAAGVMVFTVFMRYNPEVQDLVYRFLAGKLE